MPPLALTIATGSLTARSIVIETYASLAMSTFSSTSSALTSSPSGFCSFLRTLPINSVASVRASAALSANLMPPALPRPPIKTWLLSTHEPGLAVTNAATSSGVLAS